MPEKCGLFQRGKGGRERVDKDSGWDAAGPRRYLSRSESMPNIFRNTEAWFNHGATSLALHPVSSFLSNRRKVT